MGKHRITEQDRQDLIEAIKTERHENDMLEALGMIKPFEPETSDLKWYRADYDATDGETEIESLYFTASNDDEALGLARKMGSIGKDFVDVGHVDTELTGLYEVDGNSEFFPETRTVWY